MALSGREYAGNITESQDFFVAAQQSKDLLLLLFNESEVTWLSWWIQPAMSAAF